MIDTGPTLFLHYWFIALQKMDRDLNYLMVKRKTFAYFLKKKFLELIKFDHSIDSEWFYTYFQIVCWIRQKIKSKSFEHAVFFGFYH